MDADSIAEMELLASEFWPAARRTRLDNGWILGDNEGVTWRANCVLPYGELRENVVEQVERTYRSLGLPATFKVTSAVPQGLDALLDQRGYQKHMVTHVQTKQLERTIHGHSPVAPSIKLSGTPSPKWLEKQTVDERYRGPRIKVLQGILDRIPGKRAFLEMGGENAVVGVGLGVVHKKWLALFSIRVDPEYRRRGLGSAISDALLEWGGLNGAEKAFLQVEDDNGPALELYRKRDFTTAYTYWYRIQENP